MLNRAQRQQCSSSLLEQLSLLIAEVPSACTRCVESIQVENSLYVWPNSSAVLQPRGSRLRGFDDKIGKSAFFCRASLGAGYQLCRTN